MANVFDCAKYFIQSDLTLFKNTFDSSVKLQKLLVFADMISFAEYNEPLFIDQILAFTHGCVIENIRQRYKNDYANFIAESTSFVPQFSDKEHRVLDLTIKLFGHLSPRELSNINHTFFFWEDAYEKSKQPDGYKDKNKAIVDIDQMRAEAQRMKKVIAALESDRIETDAKETINGIDFYYSPDVFDMNDDVLDYLYEFSLNANENAYSIHYDGRELVIY